MNSFGTKFRLSIFGESHGNSIGVVLDGVPAGITLCEQDFEADLSRRRAGKKGTTPRVEPDQPHIVAGVFDGYTTGAPIAILFNNTNTRSKDYSLFRESPRPGHADLTASIKHNNYNDIRGGGHFSGRITLCLVAAGVVAKKMLPPAVRINAGLVELAGEKAGEGDWGEALSSAMRDGDSIGGVVECKCMNLPIGLGEPFFDSVESLISHLAFAIPGIRGIEFGDGFNASRMRGSEHNDCYINRKEETATNHAGGVNGGITNGNPVIFRIAVKPTSSITKGQETFNFISDRVEEFHVPGRHDACIALRVPVIAESIAAIAFANLI